MCHGQCQHCGKQSHTVAQEMANQGRCSSNLPKEKSINNHNNKVSSNK